MVLTIAEQREIRRDTERDIDINRDSDKEIILQIFLKFFPNHTETDFKRLLRITTDHNKDIIFTIGNHESPIDQDKLPHKQVAEFVKFISRVFSREVLGKEDVRGFYQKIECSSEGSELSGSSIKFEVGPGKLLFREDKRKIALRMLDWHKQADGFIEEFNRNPEFNLLEASLLFRKGSCEIVFRERIELKKLPFRSLGCQEYNINRQSQFLSLHP